jgi:signal transduction histidine kinase
MQGKLKQLTEDVLDVTRIESNTLQLNKEQFDLRELVIHAIEDYKNQLAVHENKIKLVYHDDDYNGGDGDNYYGYDDSQSGKDDKKILVYADKYRVNQVITNLLSNSIKFTNKDGTISIKLKKYDDINSNGNNDDNDNNISSNSTTIVSIKDTS